MSAAEPRRQGEHIAPSGGVAVEARGLTRRFGDQLAVDDVTFSIGPGET
jgi:hypothetical protein